MRFVALWFSWINYMPDKSSHCSWFLKTDLRLIAVLLSSMFEIFFQVIHFPSAFFCGYFWNLIWTYIPEQRIWLRFHHVFMQYKLRITFNFMVILGFLFRFLKTNSLFLGLFLIYRKAANIAHRISIYFP